MFKEIVELTVCVSEATVLCKDDDTSDDIDWLRLELDAVLEEELDVVLEEELDASEDGEKVEAESGNEEENPDNVV